MTNRFKGLDLIESLKNYGWRFVTLYEAVIKTISKKKKCKNEKWLSEEDFQIFVRNVCISYKRKEQNLKAKEKYPSECRVPKNSKEK